MKKDQFYLENTQQWNTILHSIFGETIPATYSWTVTSEIITVLNKIASGRSTDYTFFADGGGMSLKGAHHSHQEGCIELDFDSAYLIKLNRLDFTAIGTHSPCCNSFFRLVTAKLPTSGFYETNIILPYHEHLVELSPLKYIDGRYWDYGEYNGEDLPASARPITRILRGDLVVFSKSSVYNQITNTDDGRHDKMDVETFKQFVSEIYRAYQDVYPLSASDTPPLSLL